MSHATALSRLEQELDKQRHASRFVLRTLKIVDYLPETGLPMMELPSTTFAIQIPMMASEEGINDIVA